MADTCINNPTSGKNLTKTSTDFAVIHQLALLTREQAAKYLGLSPKTVWTHTRRGLLPYVRIGGLVRYRKQALDETMAKLETPSNALK